MKRRDFLAAAGLGTMAVQVAGTAGAADSPPDEKRGQVYKCEVCGAVFENMEPGTPPVVHCDKPMKLQKEQASGEGEAKHVPIIEKIEGGYKVRVSTVAHPMLKAHHILWIDLIADGRTIRQFLEVPNPAEAVFMVKAEKVAAKAYCNLHGLWKDK